MANVPVSARLGFKMNMGEVDGKTVYKSVSVSNLVPAADAAKVGAISEAVENLLSNDVASVTLTETYLVQ